MSEAIYVRDGKQAFCLFEQVLESIQFSPGKFAVEIVSFVRATGGLMRQGVTHIVTVKEPDGVLTTEVPMRVESPDIVKFRFCTSEMLAAWKRQTIHAIRMKLVEQWDRLIRRVTGCLKTALNCFRRKRQAMLNANQRKALKQESRRHKHEHSFFRRDAGCMAH